MMLSTLQVALDTLSFSISAITPSVEEAQT
jgi:hypothetical protein